MAMSRIWKLLLRKQMPPMSKHTPGPWRRGSRNECANIYSDKRHVATVHGHTRGRRISPTHSEASSAARLIAAAPEILKALKEITDELEFQYDMANCPSGSFETARNKLVKQSRKAISKAGGKS